MKKFLKIFLIIVGIFIGVCLILAIITGIVSWIDGQPQIDGDYEAKWLWDWVVLDSNDFDESKLLGNSGEGEIISDYALEKDASFLQANKQYYLASTYWVGLKGDTVLNPTRYFRSYYEMYDLLRLINYASKNLRFVLVLDDGTVLHDEQAVEVNDKIIFLNDPAGHKFDFSLTDNDVNREGDYTWVNDYYYVSFVPKQEGTLFVEFNVTPNDIVGYVRESAVYHVGSEFAANVTAKINDVSIGFLTEEKYKSTSGYNDNDLTDMPSFDDGNAYMVVDFDFNALGDNDGVAVINAIVDVYGTGSRIKAKIEEVSSGTIFESSESGATKMYASFKVPPKTDENKAIRMIVCLTSSYSKNDFLSSFDFDVLFVGKDDVAVTGKNYNAHTANVKSLLGFYYNDELRGYGVYGTLNEDERKNTKQIVIPEQCNGSPVCEISGSAFCEYSNLSSIVMPDTIKKIGANAFYNCSSLTNITIPSSVISIGDGTFDGCSSLTSIELPSSITSIGKEVVAFCDSLAEIIVADGNSVYHSVDNCIIETESKTLVAGCKNSVIPTDGSVVSIGDGAFYGCCDLTSIVIPVSITSIGNDVFWAWNSSSGASYNSLVSITYNGTMEQWRNIRTATGWDNNKPNDLKIYCTDGTIKFNENGGWVSE